MRSTIALALFVWPWSGFVGSATASTPPYAEEASPATPAGGDEAPRDPPHAKSSDTLTHGFWGLSETLAGHGIEVTLGSTNVYQTNAKGGLGTHQQSGRFTGSYDVEIATDFEKLLGLPGWGLLVHGWGGYPATRGINDTMVGSAFNVNWDAIGDRPLDVVEVILEWKPCADRLTFQVGKVNFARVFDTSEYANDETSQFLNGAFINNPTIPIPDYCLGALLSGQLTDSWSVAAGVGDAEAENRTTGFPTTFDGDDYFFYDLETAFQAKLPSPHGPLTGNYRVGLWYTPQPRVHSGGDEAYRNGVGVYTSVDQVLLKENDDPEDSQGLGVFARLGGTDGQRSDLTRFWSVGVQYQGLLEGREDDVLALGFAQGRFSADAPTAFTEDYESVLEFYYSMKIAPWVTVSPSAQYITNPGGDRAVPDAIAVGVRAQVAF